MGEVADIRKKTDKTLWTTGMWLVAIAYAVSGAIAMVYEVGWFRLLGLVLGPSVDTFAVVLGIYLAGLGLGSLVGSLWAKRARNSMEWFAAVQVSVGLFGLLGIIFGNELPKAYFDAFAWAKQWFGDQGYIAAHAIVAGLLVMPPTLMMGMMFPLGVKAFREAGEKQMASEQAVGRIYAMNTAGSHYRKLGGWLCVDPFSGCSLHAGPGGCRQRRAGFDSLDQRSAQTRPPFRSHRDSRAVAVFIAAIVAKLPAYDAALLNQGNYRDVGKLRSFDRQDIIDPEEESLLFYREGLNTTVAVFRLPGEANLRVAGKSRSQQLQRMISTLRFSSANCPCSSPGNTGTLR